MTGPSLEEEVRRRRERRERWQREGERPPGRNLALMGVVGWLVVIPMLLALAIGRWLDRRLDAGVTFTAALLLASTAVGALLAWRYVREA